MKHQYSFKVVSLLTWSFLTASVFNPLIFKSIENDSGLSVSLQRLPRVALSRPNRFASQFTLKLGSPWFHTANVQLHRAVKKNISLLKGKVDEPSIQDFYWRMERAIRVNMVGNAAPFLLLF